MGLRLPTWSEHEILAAAVRVGVPAVADACRAIAAHPEIGEELDPLRHGGEVAGLRAAQHRSGLWSVHAARPAPAVYGLDIEFDRALGRARATRRRSMRPASLIAADEIPVATRILSRLDGEPSSQRAWVGAALLEAERELSSIGAWRRSLCDASVGDGPAVARPFQSQSGEWVVVVAVVDLSLCGIAAVFSSRLLATWRAGQVQRDVSSLRAELGTRRD